MSLYRVAQIAALGLAVSRLRHGAKLRPVESATANPLVSVLIPARNEEGCIARCLESLEDVHEVIVIDDCSHDETGVIADKLGAHVITGRDLPRGWVGKSWALQQGLDVATGDIVICLDADTIAQPGLIGALCGQLENADFVSFATRFQCDTHLETALHSSMLAGLVYRFGPPGAPLSPTRALANGQCMAFRRDWFIKQSGFGLVRQHMTDDVALARTLASCGAEVRFVDGADFIEVDMHDGPRELWNEWGRSLPMPDASTRTQQLTDLFVVWFALALPLPRIILRRANKADIAALLIRCLLGFGIRRAYATSKLGVYLSPLTDTAAAVRLTQATIWPVRHWKGREYGPQNQLQNADR